MLMPIIEKYNKPVPRYTSYPPANYFNENFSEEDYKTNLTASNQWQPKLISLYFHIPFCNKMCHYCGCNAYGMRSKAVVENYVDALLTELKLIGNFIQPDRKVSQVHFGGGTPNALSAEMLDKIMQAAYKNFNFIENAEIAIECNPAYLDFDYVSKLAQSGFNRFSLGIQDFNLQVLEAVNRDPSKLPLNELMDSIRYNNPKSAINLDFIYGLPHQNPDTYTTTIQKAIDLKPDRMVTFSYAHLPTIFKAQKKLETEHLPNANQKMNLFETAYQLITDNQYQAIGFDHYALKTDELSIAQNNGTLHRNFQGYCTRSTTGQVYAIGVSAISQLEGLYTQNTKKIDEYIQLLNQQKLPVVKGYAVSKNEQIVREVINTFMCNKGIVWKQLSEILNVSIPDIKSAIVYDIAMLKEFANDQIIDFNNDSIQLKPYALLYMRNVAASFDPLMKSAVEIFSKSI